MTPILPLDVGRPRRKAAERRRVADHLVVGDAALRRAPWRRRPRACRGRRGSRGRGRWRRSRGRRTCGSPPCTTRPSRACGGAGRRRGTARGRSGGRSRRGWRRRCARSRSPSLRPCPRTDLSRSPALPSSPRDHRRGPRDQAAGHCIAPAPPVTRRPARQLRPGTAAIRSSTVHPPEPGAAGDDWLGGRSSVTRRA